MPTVDLTGGNTSSSNSGSITITSPFTNQPVERWSGPYCVWCLALPWGKEANRRCLCSGFNLDLGCGGNKQPGFIGMDKRDLPSVDIVWNIESMEERCPVHAPSKPWPFKDNTVDRMLSSHVLEHMKPWLTIDILNEAWRVCKPESQFMVAVPYAGSFGYYQDPTHINPFNEATWAYFDPEHKSGLYNIYKPKPWKIVRCNFSPLHNMEVILEPRK